MAIGNVLKSAAELLESRWSSTLQECSVAMDHVLERSTPAQLSSNERFKWPVPWLNHRIAYETLLSYNFIHFRKVSQSVGDEFFSHAIPTHHFIAIIDEHQVTIFRNVKQFFRWMKTSQRPLNYSKSTAFLNRNSSQKRRALHSVAARHSMNFSSCL